MTLTLVRGAGADGAATRATATLPIGRGLLGARETGVASTGACLAARDAALATGRCGACFFGAGAGAGFFATAFFTAGLATGFGATFFGATFFGAPFFSVAFFGATFFATGFFAGAAFFATGFFAGATFFTAAFFATAFFTAA